MFKKSLRNQLISTLCGNLITISYGASCGWPSASVPELQSNQSPLVSGPLSVEDGAWITSLLCAGGFFGNLFYGWIASKYGRKIPLLSLVIPNVTCWLLMVFGNLPMYIFVARFLGGIAGAGTFILLPLFIAEISDEKIRGFLGSLLVFTTNIGYVVAFTLGNYTNYRITSGVLVIPPILFGLTFMFLPETPQSLLKKGNEKSARKSLSFYKNIRKKSSVEEMELLQHELDKLKSVYNPNKKINENASLTLEDFNYPAAKKAFLIGLVLMALNQFNGSFAMLNYTATIFADSGSTMTPNMSAIVIGVIQVIGSCVSTNLVERAGRKILLGCSLLGTGIGVAILGLYIYCKSLGISVDQYHWIPIVSFSFSIFLANIGILNLPFLVVPEIMPEKIRSIGTTICMAFLWFLSFLMLKYFAIISMAFGMHTCFFVFSICSFAGSIFVFTVLPETKGKNFEEILESLGGR